MPHTSLTIEEAISVAIEGYVDHGGFKDNLNPNVELFIEAKSFEDLQQK